MCGTSLILLIVNSLQTCLDAVPSSLPCDEYTLITQALMHCLKMIQTRWAQRRVILLRSLWACDPMKQHMKAISKDTRLLHISKMRWEKINTTSQQ